MKNRLGSYKKLLLTEDALQTAGPYLRDILGVLTSELRLETLDPRDFTTLYILLYLRLRSPKNWLQRVRFSKKGNGKTLAEFIPENMNLNEWEKEKLQEVSGEELFTDFILKGIPQSVNRAMMNWYKGEWKIQMLDYIPSSRELLRLQVKNTRCITLMTSPENCAKIVLGTRDPLSFVLHDLMHADQFFGQEIFLKGQLGFYSLINTIYDKTETKTLLKSDAAFKKEFEYVASDMNAYVIHLFKCLKSSIYRTSVSESYFHQLMNWWNMNEKERLASLKLNTPAFDEVDEHTLKDFFERHQEIFT